MTDLNLNELRKVAEAGTTDTEGSKARLDPGEDWPTLPLHRTEAGWPNCATCDGGGCLDCTDPA